MQEGKLFNGRELEQLKNFLEFMGLNYDEGIEHSVCLYNDESEIIATGSVDQNVLKCIAIHPDYQGQGLAGTLVSALIQYQYEHGRTHLLLYTKPLNEVMFSDLGFYTIIKTSTVLFMENRVRGFSSWQKSLTEETPVCALNSKAAIGCIVANCNPFTLGHRYLIEESLKQCDYLHLFVLSDKRSFYPPDLRYQMVKAGVFHLPRVILHKTSDYIVSAATFPTYFMKEKSVAQKANCELDLELFGRLIAPQLFIRKRFVGTEPTCKVTAVYNQSMKTLLPDFGIDVIEIERKQAAGTAISASMVRDYIKAGNYEAVRSLIPENVLSYLLMKGGGSMYEAQKAGSLKKIFGPYINSSISSEDSSKEKSEKEQALFEMVDDYIEQA